MDTLEDLKRCNGPAEYREFVEVNQRYATYQAKTIKEGIKEKFGEEEAGEMWENVEKMYMHVEEDAS